MGRNFNGGYLQTMQNELFFIDRDYDKCILYSGNADLVREYESICDGLVIGLVCVFETKDEMMDWVCDFGWQARHGIQNYKALHDDEMKSMIRDARSDLHEKIHHVTPEISDSVGGA